MWSNTHDRIVKVDGRWIRVSSVLMVEPGDSAGTARLLLTTGHTATIALGKNGTVDDLARTLWPQPS